MKKALLTIIVFFALTAVWGQSDAAKDAYYRGCTAFDNGRYDTAITAFTEAIRLYANYEYAYFDRGNAYLNKKDYDKAITDFTEVIRLAPKKEAPYYYRGFAFENKKDYAIAKADYEAALKINPKYDDAIKALDRVKAELAKAPPPSTSAPANMVLIKGGTFTMGSPANEPGHDNWEGPQRQVTVNSFYMGKYEVTQKEYLEIMGRNFSDVKGDNLPVDSDWYNAVEYCNKRSQKEGLTPAYTINKTQEDPNNKCEVDGDKWTVTWNRNANGYRLPTEAEWEYACRAGTTTAFNTGANISDNTGWYDKNSNKGRYPVGQKPANAWGLYDMHGNADEYCWDWDGRYPDGAQTNPSGPSSGEWRVVRGGSWYGGASRSAARASEMQSTGHIDIGFRVVRNAQ